MSEHTPTPWRLRTTGNMGNLIEGDSGKRMDHLDDGYRTVGSYQECCASDKYHDQQRNRDANGAFIVKAVNNHDLLVKALTDLLDACESIGTFRNGVEHNGIDQGDVYVGGLIDQARDALTLVGGSKQP